jgi:hypothetical protein
VEHLDDTVCILWHWLYPMILSCILWHQLYPIILSEACKLSLRLSTVESLSTTRQSLGHLFICRFLLTPPMMCWWKKDLYIWLYIYIYDYMYVCTYVCIYNVYICTHTHTHTHTHIKLLRECECARVLMCVCVRERERERECVCKRERERARERKRGSARERERERERETLLHAQTQLRHLESYIFSIHTCYDI